MSYTTSDQVSKFLSSSFPKLNRVNNQSLTLSGVEQVSFFSGAVETTDFVMKSYRSNILTRNSIIFSTDQVVVSSAPLVEGSVVVAADSSLSMVFIENVDFFIDTANGLVTRNPSGNISSGQTVIVWYGVYQILTSGVDYQLTSGSGKIARISGGSVGDGESILLDYTPIVQSYDDEIIQSAVVTANGLVQNEVDPNGSFGADPALSTAATFRALEIICHTSAVRSLSSGSSGEKASTAWLRLADAFGGRANDLIKQFRPPFTNPSRPTHG